MLVRIRACLLHSLDLFQLIFGPLHCRDDPYFLRLLVALFQVLRWGNSLRRRRGLLVIRGKLGRRLIIVRERVMDLVVEQLLLMISD